MTSAKVALRILGHTELAAVGNLTGGAVLRQPKRLALLAYLALAASSGFRRRDQIIALFWPEKDQFHARTQLRKALYSLRGVLGSDAFVTRGEEEIRLNVDEVWCDAVEFLRACEAREWSSALDLYRGDLLEGLYPSGTGQEFETWLDGQRTSLRDEASRAAWECSALADLNGNPDEAIALAKRAIELHPDDEQSVRRLIAAMDRHGDRAGALRTFALWQERLRSEFGVDPAPETRKLARKVQSLRKGESLDTPSLSHAAPIAPAMSASPIPATAVPIAVRESHTRRIAAVAIVAGVVLMLGAFVVVGPDARPIADIAVLPFHGVGDSAATLLGESIADEISTTLAQGGGVAVRSFSHTREILRAGDGADDIGRRLRVKTVLEGSVLRNATRIHVRIRLTRVDDARTLWARVFDVDATDMIAAHQQIASIAERDLSAALRSAAQ